MTNFLLSSAGRRGELVKLLQSHVSTSGEVSRVLATDLSNLSAAGRLADFFTTVPACTSEGFISQTLDLCRAHEIDVLIPTIDTELSVFAENKGLFASSGIDAWVSSPETCELGFDKFKFHEWLTVNGFPSIPTQEIFSHRLSIPGPFVLKPRSGSSSKGIIFIDAYENIDALHLSRDYIVQEKISGIEITADFAVTKTGQISGVALRRRLETRAGEVSKGVTIRHKRIEELVIAIAKALPGAYGILNLQVIYNPSTEELHVLELNPRFGGGYPLAHVAGANLIASMFSSQAALEANNWEPGIVFLRYDADVSYFDDNFVSNPWG